MSQYADHYKHLHDEALIDIALRSELLPEAEAALRAELQSRGISDLSSHREVKEFELEAQDRLREQHLTHRAKVLKWRTRFLYVMSALSLAWGIALYVRHDPAKSPEDGGLFILGAPLLAVFGFLSHWASKAWDERVLYRKPPP